MRKSLRIDYIYAAPHDRRCISVGPETFAPLQSLLWELLRQILSVTLGTCWHGIPSHQRSFVYIFTTEPSISLIIVIIISNFLCKVVQMHFDLKRALSHFFPPPPLK